MDIEERLNGLHPQHPSAELDRRVERLISDTEVQADRWYRRPVALWQCAALCAAFFAAGLWMAASDWPAKQEQGERVTTIYLIENNPDALEEALNNGVGEILSGDLKTEVRVVPRMDEGNGNSSI